MDTNDGLSFFAVGSSSCTVCVGMSIVASLYSLKTAQLGV